MHISIIGSGNVATVLGRRLVEAGHTIAQVYSRDLSHALTLAGALSVDGSFTGGLPAGASFAGGSSAGAIDSLDQLLLGADVYLVALSDQGVLDVAARLRLDDALVVHTAGALPMNVLAPVSSRYGVVYPLQTIRKEVQHSLQIPLLVDGSSPSVRAVVTTLASGMSDLVRTAGDTERLRLHIGAVVVNNFPNYLYGLTQAYAQDSGVDFRLLQPLVAETARRLQDHAPFDVQTGPGARGDEATIRMHLAQLQSYPELQRWYALFSEALLRHFKGKSVDFIVGAE